jgi:SARP family transcriptional regulator, regulator of embCAB operon
MRYEILGSCRVISSGGEYTLNSRKMEMLLAALLVRADQIVPANQLLMELWEENLPRRAAAGLHVYVSQLRKFLSSVGAAEGTIVTLAPGYLLKMGTSEFDLQGFQEGIRLGRARLKEGATLCAVDTLQSALALYRGPVLGDSPGGPILASLATWVEESRLECLEMLAEASIAASRHREVVSLLYGLIAEHPLREAYYQLLMVALYRSGRRADALHVYQRACDVIVGELGLEPCFPLRELHQAILLEKDDIDVRIAV